MFVCFLYGAPWCEPMAHKMRERKKNMVPYQILSSDRPVRNRVTNRGNNIQINHHQSFSSCRLQPLGLVAVALSNGAYFPFWPWSPEMVRGVWNWCAGSDNDMLLACCITISNDTILLFPCRSRGPHRLLRMHVWLG